MSTSETPTKPPARSTPGPNSIFTRYPDVGQCSLLDGTVYTAPYHNYSADAAVVWGSMDTEWVRSRLHHPFEPVLGPDGRALASLWIIDYQDTNIGPYKELIIVFIVAHKDRPLKGGNKFTGDLDQLRALDDKECFAYIYKLWLNEPKPVAYGRELLGCDKYLDKEMVVEAGEGGKPSKQVKFEFHHMAGERFSGPEHNSEAAPGPLLKGTLLYKDQMGFKALVHAYGTKRVLKMAAGARNDWHVLCPPGVIEGPAEKVNNNSVLWTFPYETTPKFTRMTGTEDIEYGGELKAGGFTGRMIQHDPCLRGVLLPPWAYVPTTEAKAQ